MDLSTIDLVALVRAKMFEKQKTVSEIGRKIFGRPENLSKIFAGESVISPRAFAMLVKELEVRKKDELRYWLAAFLMHKEPELLSIVKASGVLDGLGLPVVSAASESLVPAGVDNSWRVLSREEKTGELRGKVLLALEAAGRPLRPADIAAGVGILPERARTVTTALESEHLVSGRRGIYKPPRQAPFVPGGVAPGFPKTHSSPFVEWELTPLGKKRLAMWKRAKEKAGFPVPELTKSAMRESAAGGGSTEAAASVRSR